MKKPGVGQRIITGILAFIISIVLIFMLLVTPLFKTVSDFVQPENLAATVKNIDLGDVVTELLDAKVFTEMGVSPQAAEAILNSSVGKTLSADYVKLISSQLVGEPCDVVIDEAYVKALVENNIDELTKIISTKSPLSDVYTDSQIQILIRQFTADNAGVIISNLPGAEDILTAIAISPEDMTTVSKVFSPWIIYGLLAVCLILAVLIFLLKRYHCKFAGWLAFDNILPGVIILLAGLSLKVGKTQNLVFEQIDANAAKTVIKAVCSSLSRSLLFCAACLLALGVIFLVLRIIANAIVRKRILKEAVETGAISSMSYVSVPQEAPAAFKPPEAAPDWPNAENSEEEVK